MIPTCRRCRPNDRVYVEIVNRTFYAAETAWPICCRSINGKRTTYTNTGHKPFYFILLFFLVVALFYFIRFFYIYSRIYKDDGKQFFRAALTGYTDKTKHQDQKTDYMYVQFLHMKLSTVRKKKCIDKKKYGNNFYIIIVF